MDRVIQLSLGIKKQPVSGGGEGGVITPWGATKTPPHPRVVIFGFTLVKNRVPELLLKVLGTNGPSRVQSTVTLPSPGAVLSTSNDSVSPVGGSETFSYLFFWVSSFITFLNPTYRITKT